MSLAGKFGTKFYWQDKGEGQTIATTVSILLCFTLWNAHCGTSALKTYYIHVATFECLYWRNAIPPILF